MKSFWKTVLLTGLLAGCLDLTAAYIDQFVKTGRFADKMLYYIAGGALGLDTSMKGGLAVGLLGLFFHFFIAFSWTLLFFWLYPRLRWQFINKYALGLSYGVFVGICMRFVVLPLTKLPLGAFDFKKAITGWLILAVVLGLPIAFIASKYYARRDDYQLSNT